MLRIFSVVVNISYDRTYTSYHGYGANRSTRLKEKVMDVRKANTEKPWPPQDREVGVVLVAHSMG